MQVNWMRDWNLRASSLLNDPVRPDALGRQFDEVVSLRVAGVAGDDVFECWFLPVNINGGHIDAPNDDVLVIGCDLFNIDVHIEGRDLACEVGARHSSVPPRLQRAFVLANTGSGGPVGCWISCSGTGICEYAAAIEVVGACTISRRFCPEPIVARRLISVDDDIVTLSNG